MSQHERYERTLTIYPDLYEHAFISRWTYNDDRWVNEYEITFLAELYFFELCAVFSSDKSISRCRYFVPKTKMKTLYCDRVQEDGRACKEHGPNLKRKDGPAEDKYLLVHKKLQARFYERYYRSYSNGRAPEMRDYDWSDIARVARMEYLKGSIGGEEFLQRINPLGEVIDLTRDDTTEDYILFAPWDKLVQGNMSFDPNSRYEDILTLKLNADDPDWRVISAEEQIRAAKQGDISLRKKFDRKE